MAVIAFGLSAIPASLDWYKWRNMRVWVNETFDLVRHSPSTRADTGLVILSNFSFRDPGKIPANVEIRHDSVFVFPPGKWASTPDEAMRMIESVVILREAVINPDEPSPSPSLKGRGN